MSYRCLMIVNPARIRCKNEQLLIETEEVHSVPIEPIIPYQELLENYDFQIIDNALRCIIPYQHNMRRIYHKFSPQVLQRPAGFVII